ncbi:hypothetical protein H1P_5410003 [Hyella patelloides LEGE 07179]|uniref:Uncharacterized protein n=1 Tax=Hyella patelloides LEGE 07179 TaxID=945734 RepID=A0A563W0C9_9CYAN|nr:hypothetical protein H1P_5410003 [Hyella patelloides LEGE 07179]
MRADIIKKAKSSQTEESLRAESRREPGTELFSQGATPQVSSPQ